MGDEIDINIIKSTQNSLGKYVKRPPLSEKLLRKPPFRFIHDIITTVLKTTGFLDGLFEEGELISDNVKDRDSKILFLTKVIYVVGTTTGKSLSIKPSKVIAGQEPEKTNELLQCIALALDSKLSSDEAVKKYKESTTKSENIEKKSKDIKKTVKKVTEPKLSSKNVVKNDVTAVTKSKHKEVSKKESPPKKTSQSLKPTSKKSVQKLKEDDTHLKKLAVSDSHEVPKQKQNENNTHKPLDEKIDIQPDNESPVATQAIEREVNNEERAVDIAIKSETTDLNLHTKENKQNAFEKEESIVADGTVNNIDNSSLENDKKPLTVISYAIDERLQEKQDTNHNISSNNSKKEIIKATSFDSIPNDIKSTNDTKIIRPSSVRPSSSRPGAPRLREKFDESIPDTDNLLVGKVKIIAENTVHEEDEESSIIIVENELLSKSEIEDEQAQLNSNQHGHLVQQILDSQKEFSQDKGKTETEWQLGAKKARDVVNQDIEQLRFNVQALSRVANPLGKLLDHIQEDVEVMRQELQHWTKTYEDASKELLKQKKINQEQLQPLYSKIKQLDSEIIDKHNKINDVKITIHKNALRIDKLLANGNKQ